MSVRYVLDGDKRTLPHRRLRRGSRHDERFADLVSYEDAAAANADSSHITGLNLQTNA
jgi:hypothetical protein